MQSLGLRGFRHKACKGLGFDRFYPLGALRISPTSGQRISRIDPETLEFGPVQENKGTQVSKRGPARNYVLL